MLSEMWPLSCHITVCPESFYDHVCHMGRWHVVQPEEANIEKKIRSMIIQLNLGRCTIVTNDVFPHWLSPAEWGHGTHISCSSYVTPYCLDIFMHDFEGIRSGINVVMLILAILIFLGFHIEYSTKVRTRFSKLEIVQTAIPNSTKKCSV